MNDTIKNSQIQRKLINLCIKKTVEYKNFIKLLEKRLYRAVTSGDRRTGFYHFIGAGLGDRIINHSIWIDYTS